MVIARLITQEQIHPKTPPLHYVRTLTKVIAAQMQMLGRATEEAGARRLSLPFDTHI